MYIQETYWGKTGVEMSGVGAGWRPQDCMGCQNLFITLKFKFLYFISENKNKKITCIQVICLNLRESIFHGGILYFIMKWFNIS